MIVCCVYFMKLERAKVAVKRGLRRPAILCLRLSSAFLTFIHTSYSYLQLYQALFASLWSFSAG